MFRLLLKNIKIIVENLYNLLNRILIKRPIYNFFKTNYSEKILISYVVKPFRKGQDLTHTHNREVVEIAKVFHELKFNVDIVDYTYEGWLDFNKYDIILGFGEPLVNSFYNATRDIIRIYFGAGMHVCTQNHNTLNRIEEVYKKKSRWLLESGRIVDKTWSAQTTLVDAMILLGNEIVKESYRKYYAKPIYLIPASIYKVLHYEEIINNKDFADAKKHYLWFGSSGLIHKGLDLLLEVFKDYTDIHLHICGPIDDEKKFNLEYYNELYKTPNIHTHGFVLLDSPLFKELLQKCAFVIYPSCSEGGSPSVLNVCGNGGLIPIVSFESTITVEDFGIYLKSINSREIINAIELTQQMSESELFEKSSLCGRTVNSINSIEKFRVGFYKSVKAIIDSHE
jgi:hypothetical protein